ENNIAYKAAELLQREFGIREGIRITLEKHIPVAAGMAGGSSNAAAVLFGMNRMFDLGLSEQGLKDRGVTLGADVPYCIMRGTVLAEGIGEILTPLPPMPRCQILLAKPRSEERRVGKECRSRWSQDDEKKKEKNGGARGTRTREDMEVEHR